MSGHIAAGPAVSVNTASSIAAENTTSFFSTWSGRNVIQQNNVKTVGIFIAVNALFLMIIKYAVLPALERQLKEKSDHTKRVIKILFVGTLLVAFNAGFAKLARYPLSNIGLSVTILSALAVSLFFGKATTKPAPNTPESDETLCTKQEPLDLAKEPITSADPTTLSHKTDEQIAEIERERSNAEENLLEIEADAAHTHATHIASALNLRQQLFEEAQERVTQAQEALTQTSQAITQAVTERQEAEQVIIVTEEADREARAAWGQKLENLNAAREALQSLLKTSGRSLSNVRQELADAIAAENSCREVLTNLQKKQAANYDDSQNDPLQLAIKKALEAVQQAEEARAIPKSIVDAVEHLSAVSAIVGDGEEDIKRTKSAFNTATERFLQAQERVRNLPSIDPFQQALNNAIIARNAAQENLEGTTRANDAAQEALRIARERASAARQAAAIAKT